MWECEHYPYSSYDFYVTKEQHPFCETGSILSYFSKSQPNLSYKEFVEEAKVEDPDFYNLCIDFEV